LDREYGVVRAFSKSSFTKNLPRSAPSSQRYKGFLRALRELCGSRPLPDITLSKPKWSSETFLTRIIPSNKIRTLFQTQERRHEK
jgi:hypothetical protein